MATKWDWTLFIVRKYAVVDDTPDWQPEDEEIAEVYVGKSKEEAIQLARQWLSSHPTEVAAHELLTLEYAPSSTDEEIAESVSEAQEDNEVLWPARFRTV